MKKSDAFYMALADAQTVRSTCDRANVGCVLVTDNGEVVGVGANIGAARCDDIGHLMHDDHCCRATHAEIRALADAAQDGLNTNDCTAYATHYPCISCAHALAAHGIVRIVYRDAYRQNDATAWVLEAAGVVVERFSA